MIGHIRVPYYPNNKMLYQKTNTDCIEQNMRTIIGKQIKYKGS